MQLANWHACARFDNSGSTSWRLNATACSTSCHSRIARRRNNPTSVQQPPALLLVGDSNDRNMFWAGCGVFGGMQTLPGSMLTNLCVRPVRNPNASLAYLRLTGILKEGGTSLERREAAAKQDQVIRDEVAAFVKHVKQRRLTDPALGLHAPIVISVNSLLWDLHRWPLRLNASVNGAIGRLGTWLTPPSSGDGFYSEWEQRATAVLRGVVEGAGSSQGVTVLWRTVPLTAARPFSDCIAHLDVATLLHFRRIEASGLQRMIDQLNGLGRWVAASLNVSLWDLAELASHSISTLPTTPETLQNATFANASSDISSRLSTTGVGQRSSANRFTTVRINPNWQTTWVTTANCGEDQHIQPLLARDIYDAFLAMLEPCAG